jgi:CheY-like chemotaxis protein
MKMLKRLIGEDITVQTDLDPNLWTNMADPGNMEQVIMNLIVNAKDAMPEGGTIRIKAENLNIDKDYCEINIYARPGKFTCLSVEDTGVGMDKEIIQHIFDPFFTTKGIGKGTGIGLSVVYGIVKQHEGWINVYSEPGRGSVFKVYLPASFVESNGEAKEEVISIQDCHGKGERILLVEDDDGIREFAKRVLFESGYVGFEAANAEEALNIFGKEKGDFHLVFSDVVLPEKSGLQLVEQLLCRKPELKVLLTSGYTDQKSQWPVICEKGYRFIQKPYGLTDLLRVVREVIEQGR